MFDWLKADPAPPPLVDADIRAACLERDLAAARRDNAYLRTVLKITREHRDLLMAEVGPLREENVELRERKDEAYRQRNTLVAALARLFPSGVKRTAIPGWSEDWHGCCYIDLPTGQISYHFHDSQGHLFAGLPHYEGEWDGHDKDVVEERLAGLGLRLQREAGVI